MIPAAFDYHRPADLSGAVRLLAEHGDEALVVAGGHSLIPMMKLRMAQPGHLIDLRAIESLRGVRVEGGTVTLGAMTTQAEIIASGPLADACPILREAALQIADPQVRNLGTVGGNAANGDPGNDLPAVLMALDARYVLEGAGGRREVAACEYYEGAFATARDDGEILTAIRFESPPAGHGCAYEKQKRKVGDYATAAAAVILVRSGGTCTHASIALTNVADRPLLAAEAGAALTGTAAGEADVAAACAAAQAIAEPVSDGRGSAAFRTRLTGVIVRRAIERALATAA